MPAFLKVGSGAGCTFDSTERQNARTPERPMPGTFARFYCPCHCQSPEQNRSSDYDKATLRQRIWTQAPVRNTASSR